MSVMSSASFGISLFGVLCVVGCSSDEAASSAAADASAAGQPSSGGASASSGGAPSSGGTVATGGAAGGSGGAPSSGGTGPPDAAADSELRDAAADALLPEAGTRPEWLWQVPWGRSFAAHTVIDSKGAAIVSGSFSDAETVTLGTTTLTSQGAGDTIFARILPTGAVDWARSYGAAGDDYPVSFVLDAADRITLAGLYNGTGKIAGPDFPPFAGTPGRFDVYVTGLTAAGDYRWQTTINTTADCFPGPGLALDSSSNVFVVGSFMGTAKIGGVDHASTGGWDAYFTRFDEPNGTLGAVSTFGGTGDDRAVSAVLTSTDVVVFGTFQGQVTFPTSPPKALTSAGGTDIFVARVSMGGTMTSAAAFGGAADEVVEDARLDADGSIVVSGEFTSPSISVLGDKALKSSGGRDFFVARLRSDLSPAWSVSFGGTADDYVRDLALGPGGDIAITGEFRNSITFGSRTHFASRAADSGPTEIDMFLAKLSKDGVPIWSTSAGGPAPDRGLGVALDASSAVYLTSSFQSPIDFGGGKVLTPEPGQWSSALVKYAP